MNIIFSLEYKNKYDQLETKYFDISETKWIEKYCNVFLLLRITF